jgi:phosphoenolpyruvate carboxykinase (ATP)
MALTDDFNDQISELLGEHGTVYNNSPRDFLIKQSIENKEAVVSECGALAVWNGVESTGRSPKDTYIVKHPSSEHTIDWDSPNCIPTTRATFDLVMKEALDILNRKEEIYVTDRVLGADPNYSLPCKTITDKALTALFTDNMFRPIIDRSSQNVFENKPFTMIALPNYSLKGEKWEGKLRKLGDSEYSEIYVAMDFDRRLGLIVGSSYCGTVKKMMFTVMNYYLPEHGILPLHCSANEGNDGDSALLLGLSGTGKTTLSADPTRALLGDDEHGWDDNGIANFENGCYAKLINLNPEKEPEIYNAVFHQDDYEKHGVIIENCLMYPNGTFDVDDDRLTPNSRASFPLTYLSNTKKSSVSTHPKTILFLTADANGVLPPISKLSKEQTMLWFLMGYTSKLAGTETGIIDPVSVFSRFFGEPFMPRNPEDYTSLMGKKIDQHDTNVFLVNTGWSGGAFGVGKRMDITLTRTLINAALNGKLDDVEYREDHLFHLSIPMHCPGVDPKILNPKDTWSDPRLFEQRAKMLAQDFSDHFDKHYGNKNINPKVKAQCPGK